MMLPVIALLGRKDEPTDAVEEYCRYLGAALQIHDIQMEIRRVPWEIHGWRESLRALQLQAANWRDTWVIVQYTALAWSARGFPFRFLHVLRLLKSAGARVGIVFHDVEPFSSPRLIDQLRRRAQAHVMRTSLQLCDLAIFTVPLYKLSWLPFTPTNALYSDPTAPPDHKLPARVMDRARKMISEEEILKLEARNKATDNPSPLLRKCHFIPVGPNLPIPGPDSSAKTPREIPTIGVFSITGGEQGARETRIILTATKGAAEKIPQLRLSVFGRHAELRKKALSEGLRSTHVQLSVEGILDQNEIVERLRACDVLLFVRGGISTRRSSAIAGISCGVPMIAFAGSETSWPFQDAGVVLVSPTNLEELTSALIHLMSDADYRNGLALTNRLVYEEHFSWVAIAARFAAFLKSDPSAKGEVRNPVIPSA